MWCALGEKFEPKSEGVVRRSVVDKLALREGVRGEGPKPHGPKGTKEGFFINPQIS